MLNKSLLIAAVALFPALSAFAQKPAPLVIISLDGMRPDYVTHADEHGLKVPTLRTFLTQGTWAEGVEGVIPTVTYPSHTTIVTGVWPVEHGIYSNVRFDPLGEHPGVWYWEFSAIEVETLYQAASKAGLRTGAVSWPVTVGAPIDYNIAEHAQSEETATPAISPYNPPDILERLHIHPAKDADTDETKTAEAVAILRQDKPDLMLVHLANLDHQEHQHSPFSPEANAALEKLDVQVHQIEQAALAVDPATRIAIVSDHGFYRIDHIIHLNALFTKAGLITLGHRKAGEDDAPVLSWKAEAWTAGGSCAILLHDTDDAATLAKVKAVLDKAKANPKLGIAQILSHDEIAARGGFPNAAFLVEFKEGFGSGGNTSGAVVEDSPHTGTHGYLPSTPAMRSAFMLKGRGIAAGRDLKVIDMRQIAPSFAEMLGVTLPAAKQPPVHYQP
ncbi:ectonucleotide pyrophosphatase/phosphodiesterase [Granulicella sp. WH15]|uniref:alkaline phosphatase family protein n=1 Tax=Granulicella sp. WH15 TaxID=2602070 RepID=UPI0021025F48|nr:ectonucleotide pyrophosphatase/phosphodiesterase [Granulicella sp. WH15]